MDPHLSIEGKFRTDERCAYNCETLSLSLFEASILHALENLLSLIRLRLIETSVRMELSMDFRTMGRSLDRQD